MFKPESLEVLFVGVIFILGLFGPTLKYNTIFIVLLKRNRLIFIKIYIHPENVTH